MEKKEKDDTEEVIEFEKSQLVRHLKPLYIKAYIDGRLISRVLIDGGAIMNVILIKILRKLGKTQMILERLI